MHDVGQVVARVLDLVGIFLLLRYQVAMDHVGQPLGLSDDLL